MGTEMARKIIRLKDHPESLDPTARFVREKSPRQPYGGWTIFSVRKGYVVALPDLMAIDGVFATEREAVDAAEMATGGGQ